MARDGDPAKEPDNQDGCRISKKQVRQIGTSLAGLAEMFVRASNLIESSVRSITSQLANIKVGSGKAKGAGEGSKSTSDVTYTPTENLEKSAAKIAKKQQSEAIKSAGEMLNVRANLAEQEEKEIIKAAMRGLSVRNAIRLAAEDEATAAAQQEEKEIIKAAMRGLSARNAIRLAAEKAETKAKADEEKEIIKAAINGQKARDRIRKAEEKQKKDERKQIEKQENEIYKQAPIAFTIGKTLGFFVANLSDVIIESGNYLKGIDKSFFKNISTRFLRPNYSDSKEKSSELAQREPVKPQEIPEEYDALAEAEAEISDAYQSEVDFIKAQEDAIANSTAALEGFSDAINNADDALISRIAAEEDLAPKAAKRGEVEAPAMDGSAPTLILDPDPPVTPKVEAPCPVTPKVEAPAPVTPKVEAPCPVTPKVEAPCPVTPKVEAPAPVTPKVEAPAPVTPKVEAPAPVTPEKEESPEKQKPKGFATGGEAMGTDTVPAMLTPGEIVVNKKASKKYGPLLNAINSGKVGGFARGGFVGSVAGGIGRIGQGVAGIVGAAGRGAAGAASGFASGLDASGYQAAANAVRVFSTAISASSVVATTSIKGLSTGLQALSVGVVGPVDMFNKLVGFAGSFVEAVNPALMQQLSLAFKDLQAVIGAGLQPIIAAAIPIVRAFADKLQPVMQALMPTFDKLAQSMIKMSGPIITILIEAFGALEPVITQISSAIEAWASILTFFTPIISSAFKEIVYRVTSLATTFQWLVGKIISWIPGTGNLGKNLMESADASQKTADAYYSGASTVQKAIKANVKPGASAGAAARQASFTGISEFGRNLMQQAFSSSTQAAALKTAEYTEKTYNELTKMNAQMAQNNPARAVQGVRR